MEKLIRLLLVENQSLVRIGMKTVLETQSNFEVAGEAETGAEGLKFFRQISPDVTILSLRLPDSCAIDTIENYLAEQPKAKILILAEHAGDAEISRSLKKGAFGYICKDVSASELVKAVRAVAAGKKYLQAEVAEILNENYGQEELTPSERNILQQIVGGKANKEIAYALNISENTVKTHIKNIFDKIGVSDRTSAATMAIRRGLVRVDL